MYTQIKAAKLDDNGFFVSESFLQVDENGVTLSKKNHIENLPGLIPAGKLAKWNGSTYDLIDDPRLKTWTHKATHETLRVYDRSWTPGVDYTDVESTDEREVFDEVTKTWSLPVAVLDADVVEAAKAYRDQLFFNGPRVQYNGDFYTYDDNLKGVLLALSVAPAGTISDPYEWSAKRVIVGSDPVEYETVVNNLSNADFVAIGLVELQRRNDVNTRYKAILATYTTWTRAEKEAFILEPSGVW